MRRFFALELLDNRYPQLHGLRVLAIVSVVQFHITSIFALEQAIRLDRDWVVSSLAVFFGMDLFFILSGFLIGSILLYSLKQKDTQKHPIRRFYLRRIFRTFPSSSPRRHGPRVPGTRSSFSTTATPRSTASASSPSSASSSST